MAYRRTVLRYGSSASLSPYSGRTGKLSVDPRENPPLGTRQADPIAELAQFIDPPYAKVGGLAGFDRSDLMREAERPGGIDRHSGDRLLRGQTEQGAGHVHDELRVQHAGSLS